MKTKAFIRSMPRYLALTSLMALAACQHTAPNRMGSEPAANRQAAVTQQAAQQAPQAGGQQSGRPAAGQAAPAITFHLAQTSPAQGLVQLRLDSGESLYALPRPVFTQADMRQVVSIQDQNGQAFLRFDFNQPGAAKLAQVTRGAVGHYLIVSVHGKLIAIQRISALRQEGELPVRVNSETDAQAILQSLR